MSPPPTPAGPTARARATASTSSPSPAAGQYRISDGVAGEWVEYCVDVAAAGQYTIEFRVANRDPGSAFHLEMNGLGMSSNLTGPVAVPDTNSFDAFTTVTRTVTLVAGPQVFRFVIDANAPASGYGPSLDWMRVTAVVTQCAPETVPVSLADLSRERSERSPGSSRRESLEDPWSARSSGAQRAWSGS